jgi:hypothetical protein
MMPVRRRCVKTRAALGVNRVDGRIVRCPTGSGSSIAMARTGLSGGATTRARGAPPRPAVCEIVYRVRHAGTA